MEQATAYTWSWRTGRSASSEADRGAADVENQRLAIDLAEEVDVAPLVSLMVSAGVQVEEVRRGKASLEEVFLTLMEEQR